MYPDNKAITLFGEPIEWPGVTAEGKFTNGSFDDPLVKPSFIPAETINLVIDNLSGLITKLGGSPNNTSATQLANLFSFLADPNKAIMRDENGRAKVSAPIDFDDIARKAEADALADSLQNEIEARKAEADSLKNEIAAQKVKMEALWIKYFLKHAYIQLPWYPQPDAVFSFAGHRWQEIIYNGAFFRTRGAGANAFNASEQGDAMRRLYGEMSFYGVINGVATGVFKKGAVGNATGVPLVSNEGAVMDTLGVVPTAGENRPRNYTIRVWRLVKI